MLLVCLIIFSIFFFFFFFAFLGGLCWHGARFPWIAFGAFFVLLLLVASLFGRDIGVVRSVLYRCWPVLVVTVSVFRYAVFPSVLCGFFCSSQNNFCYFNYEYLYIF